jgi:hypothetical protein
VRPLEDRLVRAVMAVEEIMAEIQEDTGVETGVETEAEAEMEEVGIEVD